jgi:acyl phosphate:glycerol-3-phosphate acyltransferase
VRQLLVAVAYLLGSFPTAYLLVRLAGRGDVRRIGSGNVGATNTLRAAGWKLALLVLLVDVGKGALAVWLMRQATGDPGWIALAGLAAIAGHCFPVWLRFEGGKGVATLAGVYGTIAPHALVVVAGVWLIGFGLTRIVALASLLAAAALPVAVYVVIRPPAPVMVATVLVALVVMWRHRSNLQRIVRGEEPRFGKGEKP